MADLVTLDEAKMFIRVDHSDDDAMIAMMITAASDAVTDVATAWDSEGDVPDRMKLAVLARVGQLYDKMSLEGGKGELGMLTPLRTLEV